VDDISLTDDWNKLQLVAPHLLEREKKRREARIEEEEQQHQLEELENEKERKRIKEETLTKILIIKN
jgi:hypothetical protein